VLLNHNLPPIKGSAVHLEKAFMNLILNAVDAMPDGGTLTVETFYEKIDKLMSGYDKISHGNYIVLRIKDTGCGISEEKLDKIFEPYYSSKKMQKRSGSGLGLSVVYGVIKDHLGYYDVISEVGVGTEFILYFPVTGERVDDSVRDEELTGGTETILVVDDILDQRDLSKELLDGLGYKVSTAKNREEALAYFINNKVDLLILDMNLEEKYDGLDIYKEMLSHKPKQKAIIVSGYSESDRVKEAMLLGVGGYIKKPYDYKTLSLAVRKELDIKTKPELV